MFRFYIHHTGYLLTKEDTSVGTLPYLLSTESSFSHPMVNKYFTFLAKPTTWCSSYYTQHLMENYIYYLHKKSPVPINSLLYIKWKDTEYSINITKYKYLLN